MGCWNFTCGLTGLPIHSDDPVIAMMIRDDGYGRLEGSRRDLSPSYPWQMFSPASLLVRGTYDDYGFIDADDAEFAKMMLAEKEARILSIDVEMQDKDGKTVYGFGNKKLDMAYSVDQDARHKMRDLPFTIWMAHASVYDRFVAEMTYEDHRTGWKPVTIKSGVQKELTAAINEHQKEGGSMFNTPWREGASTFVGAAVSYIGDRMQSDMYARQPDARYPDRKLSPEDFAMLTSAWADLKALYHIMECLRINLAPCGGCGSQDGDLAPYKLRTLAINDVMAAREKKIGEWNAEYGDEEDEDGADATA